MSKRTVEYWIERATRREERTTRTADSLVRQVRALHDRAQSDIEQELRAVLRTYRRKGQLSSEEAQKMLNSSESAKALKELEKILDDVTDNKVRHELLARINAPAYRHRLTRLQAMQDQVDAECTRLAGQTIARERDTFITALREEFDRHAADLEQGTGVFMDFTAIPSEAMDQALAHSWHGQDYSASVWENTHDVAKEAKDIIQTGLLSGKSVAKMTAQLRERFNVAKYKAERVIRTEMNYLHNQADLQLYQQLGIDTYRFLATLDSRTCKVCGALDQKTFATSEAIVGKNFPPIHPNDRCTTIPVLDGEHVAQGQRRSRDPMTGKTDTLVSGDTTYTQWSEEQDARYGAGTVDKMRRMNYNKSTDRKQFEAYKQRLGTEAPQTFKEFQKLKYDNPETYKELCGLYSYKGRVPEATATDYNAYKAIKATGVTGSIRVPPKTIDTAGIAFNDSHATRHGCTLEQAVDYIKSAKCSITRKRWNGYSVNYYSTTGAAYIDQETQKIKTSYSSADYDPLTKRIMEVFQ